MKLLLHQIDRSRMHDARTVEGIRHKFLALSPVMDERMRRQWAAAEAKALGWGGITAVAEATGLAWNRSACRHWG